VAHLWSNIAATKLRFPNSNITIIYSDKVHERKIRNLDIDSFYYIASGLDDLLFQQLTKNFKFRSGFWRYSLERLIALDAWHSKNESETSFIHIESDILMMPNFPLEKISEIKKLTWIRYNESHDVSAVLSSPNAEFTQWMANSIRDEVRENGELTDMTALSLIRKAIPEKVYLLPTVSYSSNTEFDGVFDGASIGMWLNGRDPRNHYGLVKRHEPTVDCEDRAENLVYQIRKKNLYVTQNDLEQPLFNLHIHSKNKVLLSKWYLSVLWMDVQRAQMSFASSTFSALAFLRVFSDFKKRNGKSYLKVAAKFIKRKFYK
jgi:hypothetical protein